MFKQQHLWPLRLVRHGLWCAGGRLAICRGTLCSLLAQHVRQQADVLSERRYALQRRAGRHTLLVHPTTPFPTHSNLPQHLTNPMLCCTIGVQGQTTSWPSSGLYGGADVGITAGREGPQKGRTATR